MDHLSLKGYCELGWSVVEVSVWFSVLLTWPTAHLVSSQKAEYELIDRYLEWVRYIR